MKFTQFLVEMLGDQDYKLPKDKEQQLYDFYMLSLIKDASPKPNSKDFDNEDKVNYRIHEINSILLPELKKNLLDAVFYSICAETRHIFDRNSVDTLLRMAKEMGSEYEKGLRKYTKELAIFKNDKAIQVARQPRYNKEFEKEPQTERKASFLAALKSGLSKADFVKLAEKYYRDASWSASFGGKKWAEICHGWTKLNEAQTDNHITVWIDHVYDLQHNTDTVFNKIESYMKDGDYKWLKKALDHKAKIKDPHELIDKISHPMKRIALRAIKAKTGKTYEDFIKGKGQEPKTPQKYAAIKPAFVKAVEEVIKKYKIKGPVELSPGGSFLLWGKHPSGSGKNKTNFVDIKQEIMEVGNLDFIELPSDNIIVQKINSILHHKDDLNLLDNLDDDTPLKKALKQFVKENNITKPVTYHNHNKKLSVWYDKDGNPQNSFSISEIKARIQALGVTTNPTEKMIIDLIYEILDEQESQELEEEISKLTGIPMKQMPSGAYLVSKMKKMLGTIDTFSPNIEKIENAIKKIIKDDQIISVTPYSTGIQITDIDNKVHKIEGSKLKKRIMQETGLSPEELFDYVSSNYALARKMQEILKDKDVKTINLGKKIQDNQTNKILEEIVADIMSSDNLVGYVKLSDDGDKIVWQTKDGNTEKISISSIQQQIAGTKIGEILDPSKAPSKEEIVKKINEIIIKVKNSKIKETIIKALKRIIKQYDIDNYVKLADSGNIIWTMEETGVQTELSFHTLKSKLVSETGIEYAVLPNKEYIIARINEIIAEEKTPKNKDEKQSNNNDPIVNLIDKLGITKPFTGIKTGGVGDGEGLFVGSNQDFYVAYIYGLLQKDNITKASLPPYKLIAEVNEILFSYAINDIVGEDDNVVNAKDITVDTISDIIKQLNQKGFSTQILKDIAYDKSQDDNYHLYVRKRVVKLLEDNPKDNTSRNNAYDTYTEKAYKKLIRKYNITSQVHLDKGIYITWTTHINHQIFLKEFCEELEKEGIKTGSTPLAMPSDEKVQEIIDTINRIVKEKPNTSYAGFFDKNEDDDNSLTSQVVKVMKKFNINGEVHTNYVALIFHDPEQNINRQISLKALEQEFGMGMPHIDWVVGKINEILAQNIKTKSPIQEFHELLKNISKKFHMEISIPKITPKKKFPSGDLHNYNILFYNSLNNPNLVFAYTDIKKYLNEMGITWTPSSVSEIPAVEIIEAIQKIKQYGGINKYQDGDEKHIIKSLFQIGIIPSNQTEKRNLTDLIINVLNNKFSYKEPVKEEIKQTVIESGYKYFDGNFYIKLARVITLNDAFPSNTSFREKVRTVLQILKIKEENVNFRLLEKTYLKETNIIAELSQSDLSRKDPKTIKEEAKRIHSKYYYVNPFIDSHTKSKVLNLIKKNMLTQAGNLLQEKTGYPLKACQSLSILLYARSMIVSPF